MLRFKGIKSWSKLHRKERSWTQNKDVMSLRINLGTSCTEGRALANCTILAPWDLNVDFGARKIECSTFMWTKEMMRTRKIATIFLWALLLKSTLLILLVFTRYSTIIKHTESEKSLHGVLQELWYNIPSDTITSLRAHNRLPSTDPDVVNILRQFDYPFNFHKNYGQRLTGYLQVRSSNIIFFYKI